MFDETPPRREPLTPGGRPSMYGCFYAEKKVKPSVGPTRWRVSCCHDETNRKGSCNARVIVNCAARETDVFGFWAAQRLERVLFVPFSSFSPYGFKGAARNACPIFVEIGKFKIEKKKTEWNSRKNDVEITACVLFVLIGLVWLPKQWPKLTRETGKIQFRSDFRVISKEPRENTNVENFNFYGFPFDIPRKVLKLLIRVLCHNVENPRSIM